MSKRWGKRLVIGMTLGILITLVILLGTSVHFLAQHIAQTDPSICSARFSDSGKAPALVNVLRG